jgi:hypothetical protein
MGLLPVLQQMAELLAGRRCDVSAATALAAATAAATAASIVGCAGHGCYADCGFMQHGTGDATVAVSAVSAVADV